VTGDRRSGVPTTSDLLEAVTEYLRDELLPAADGATRYQLRVCVAALEIARRDLTYGPAVAAEHQRLLATLGVSDDAALAAEIRRGLSPERFAEIRSVLQRQNDLAVSLVRPGNDR
jgi:hypothetical protein